MNCEGRLLCWEGGDPHNHGTEFISLDLSHLNMGHLIQISALGLFAVRKETWASSQGKSYQSKQLNKTCGGGLTEAKELSKSCLMSSTQGQSWKPWTCTSPELECGSKSLCPAMQLNQCKFNITNIPLLPCTPILPQTGDTCASTWPFIRTLHTKTPILNIGYK